MAVSILRGGQRQTYGQFGSFATPQSSDPIYVKPKYLINAAKRKYGRNIFVIGATDSELNEFWENVEIKASGFNQRPKEVARSIVDITAKEHKNTSDIIDSVEIYNNKMESRKEHKSYSLAFEKGWEFGGSLNVGASFFNIIGVGGASLGLGGSAKRTKNKAETSTKQEERSLSQQYSMTSKLQVPPRTALTATITTYAVTYKVTINAVFSTPTHNWIPLYYKSRFSKLFCAGTGPACRSNGFITAEELFQHETDFTVVKDDVTFTRETYLSYLGETIQMHKMEKPL